MSLIAATPDILKKLGLLGLDLAQYSLETVRMLVNVAVYSGFGSLGLARIVPVSDKLHASRTVHLGVIALLCEAIAG